MHDSHDRSPRTLQRLEVYVRKTHGGDGAVEKKLNVPCPRRHALVELRACGACEHCVDAWLGPDGGGVVCAQRPDSHAAQGAPRGLMRAASKAPVRVAMNGNVVSVTPDVSVEAATALMLEHGLGGMPVLDADGRPVGMVTRTDLLRARHEGVDAAEGARTAVQGSATRAYAGEREREEAGVDFAFQTEEIAPATVREVMTPVVFAVLESTPIATAVTLMLEHKLRRVPVVSAVGELVGMLSPLDVMRWLARGDETVGGHDGTPWGEPGGSDGGAGSGMPVA